MIQIDFVSVDKSLRTGPYTWAPTDEPVFIEAIVNGVRYRIDMDDAGIKITSTARLTVDCHSANALTISNY